MANPALTSSARRSLRLGVLTYALLLAAPVGGKLLGYLPGASWWLVSVAAWGPAVFTLVFILLGLLLPRRWSR